MVDHPAENFDKCILVLGRGSSRGLCKYRCLFYLGRGGVRLNFLPRIPFFSGIFSGRRGIRGGCGVWLRILTRISLFLAVAPCRACKNIGINFVWGGGVSGLEFFQGSPFFGGFSPGGEGSEEGMGFG